ncbi:hypothetical protein ACVWV7_000668 [Aeromonas hydrophila]
MADKDYHYRLTSEGLIAIYQDAIPDVTYKIVRGLAWLGVLVYQVRYPWSVLVVWHFLQFSLLILKKEESVEYTLLNKSKVNVIEVANNAPFIQV